MARKRSGDDQRSKFLWNGCKRAREMAVGWDEIVVAVDFQVSVNGNS